MIKKINFKKIETKVPYDTFISKIDGLVGQVKNVTLDANVISKKIYELSDDTMFVLLNIFDNTGEMSALLVGHRDSDFQTLIQDIKIGLKYRIVGNVSMIDDSFDESLPFLDKISGDKVFCIYAIQNYNHTTFGIDMDEFQSCMDLEEQYNVIAKYTDYLNDIPVDMVKTIEVSCYQEVVILLKDGTAFVNGKKILDDVKYITLIDIRTICAIGAEKTITCLTNKGRCGQDFINDNNYHYKKIVFTEFGIAALTHEKTVRYYGDFEFGAIDYSRFIDVDDIGLGDSDDIIIIKGDKVYSLFLYSPTVNVSDINVEDYLHGRWII